MSTPLAELRGSQAMARERNRLIARIVQHNDDIKRLIRMRTASTNALERWTLTNAIDVLQRKVDSIMMTGQD